MTTNCPHNVRRYHALKSELKTDIWNLLAKHTNTRFPDDFIPSDNDVVSILDSIKSEFLNPAHEVN